MLADYVRLFRVRVLSTLDAEAAIASAADLVQACDDTRSLEDAAQRVACFVRDALKDARGATACPLVRVYKTHPFGNLPPELQEFARESALHGEQLNPQTLCLTLLGTAGTEQAWNDRRLSQSHQAIPLSSVSAVERLPMIAHLLHDLGIDVAALTDAEIDLETTVSGGRLGVFHVPYAKESRSVPAQADFVRPYGIESAFGVGALLGPKDVVALVAFTTVRVSSAVAGHLAALAEGVTQVFRPVAGHVFADNDDPPRQD